MNAPMTEKSPFEYQKPNEYHVLAIERVREACKSLHSILLELPACRERSLAITKLEEVSLWANKGIVFSPMGLKMVLTGSE